MSVARPRIIRRFRGAGGWSFVLALSKTIRSRLLLTAAMALIAFAAISPASAQGRLEARYIASLAGIPIGSGRWVIEIADTHYSAEVNGSTTGLLHAFTGGEGSTIARGTLNAGRTVSSIYAATISTSKKTEEVHLTTSNGDVKDFKVEPPPDADPERVPITEAHQHGILDPMTASLMRMPGNGNPVSAEACQHTLAIFDGRLRYDLQLAFKRMDRVKADKGYAGPVVVCAVYFSPIAGHIPSRAAVKYIAKQRDMEIWLAPIAGTRVLVPFRAQGPTPIGHAVLEATQFVAVASPTRASVNGTKTQ
jgi:Protein of unknown function (DUF3108)